MDETEDDLVLTEDHFTEDKDSNAEEIVSTCGQIESAIAKHIKVLRSQTNEEMKKKLVQKICELRIKLNHLNDLNEQKYVCGHKLDKCEDNSKNGPQLICDLCLKKAKTKIFGLKKNENYLLKCQFCQLIVHRFCQNNNLLRKCPKLMFEKNELSLDRMQSSQNVILKICPEIGLSGQEFRCGECKALISPTNSHLCDYSGLYFCFNCHFGSSDSTVIPARIIHNWDFTPRPVSRRSLQIINYLKYKPILFNLTELNSMLYGLVEELPQIKRVRSELSQMSKYIRLCKQPTKPKISINSYLIDEKTLNSYSLSDFCDLQRLLKSLSESHNRFMAHIINQCEGCRGKGFFCELCRDRDDLLFPFSANIANCLKCSAVYHKNCYYRRNKVCPRCKRLEAKQSVSIDD